MWIQNCSRNKIVFRHDLFPTKTKCLEHKNFLTTLPHAFTRFNENTPLMFHSIRLLSTLMHSHTHAFNHSNSLKLFKNAWNELSKTRDLVGIDKMWQLAGKINKLVKMKQMTQITQI